jgi:hypothetical protein
MFKVLLKTSTLKASKVPLKFKLLSFKQIITMVKRKNNTNYRNQLRKLSKLSKSFKTFKRVYSFQKYQNLHNTGEWKLLFFEKSWVAYISPTRLGLGQKIS